MSSKGHLKNLLFVSPSIPFPPYADGAKLHLHMLLKHLSERGHRITLICYGSETDPAGDLRKYCRMVCVPPPASKTERISRFRKTIGNLSLLPRLSRIYTGRAMRSKIREILQDQPVDLIQSNSIWMARNASDIDEYPKLMNAVDADSKYYCRNFLVEKSLPKRLMYLLHYLKVKRLEMRIYPLYDACTVVSPRDRDYFSSFLKDVAVHVTRNGVDTEYFSPMTLKEEFPSLVFTGVMDYPPNARGILHFIEEVLPFILRQYPDVSLYVVGRNPTRELMKRASTNIHVTGTVDDLRPYLQKASLYVCPLYSGAGMKNKLLEAMAVGKPVVATAMSLEGIPEARHGQHVVVARDTREFATGVVDLLGNPDLRRSMGLQARELACHAFSWGATAEAFEHVYNEAQLRFTKRHF